MRPAARPHRAGDERVRLGGASRRCRAERGHVARGARQAAGHAQVRFRGAAEGAAAVRRVERQVGADATRVHEGDHGLAGDGVVGGVQLRVGDYVEKGAVEAADWAGVEPTAFFALLRDHTMMGFYGDPRHGGNKDRVSWRMLGVPDPPIRGRLHETPAPRKG